MEEFLPEFAEATMENWQSEFLQLFTMVVLTSILTHKGSPESKSSEEEQKKHFQKIEEMLREIKDRRV